MGRKYARALLRASPQAFVDLFLPGASYIREQPQKLQSHQRTIDGLVEVLLEGETLQRSNKHDVPWLERTYRYMYDILIESPFYKEIIARGVEEGLKQGKEQGLKQGKEQGLEEGLEQGLEKGQLKALRQAVLDIIRERLPALTQFAEVQVETINDVIQLRRLIVKMSTVPGTEQAQQAFLGVQRAQ